MRVEDTDTGLRGHTDGVLVFKNHSAILEVKTAGDEKVSRLKNYSSEGLSLLFHSESPWYGYWHQASTYASLIRKMYPQLPPMTHVEYLIFSRDTPKNVVAISLEVPTDDQWWQEIRARVLMAKEARTARVLPKGFAETKAEISNLPTCKWCSHKDVCLQPAGLVRYEGDALYDKRLNESLTQILKKEKDMGSIIRGDVVESTDVLVPTTEKPQAPAPEKEEAKPDDDKANDKD